jgi:hypothetical protein
MAAPSSARGPVQAFGSKTSSNALFNRTPLRRMNRNVTRSPIRAAADDRTVTLLDYGEKLSHLNISPISFVCTVC